MAVLPLPNRELNLPGLDTGATAEDAFLQMQAAGVSGAVALVGGSWRLYEAVDVVLTLAGNRAARLIDVPHAQVLEPVSATEEDAVALVRPNVAKPIVFGASRGLAVPALRADIELLDRLEAAPRDCYCGVDRKPVRGGVAGGNCPDGHVGSVRCR